MVENPGLTRCATSRMVPGCAGPGRTPIFRHLPSSSMRRSFARRGRAEHRGDLFMVAPLMPKATAVWLVENTALSFDPVTLGLCSQIDLDMEVQRAAKDRPAEAPAPGATLLPASETTIRREPEPEEKKPADELNVDAVFAKLKQLGGKRE